MNSELRKAIYNLGKNITGLNGGFWYIEAPQKTPFPYAVFSFVSNPFSRDTASKFEDYYLQINIYDKSASNIETIKYNFTNTFDDSESNFSLNSWLFERIERQFAIGRKIDKTFMISLQYKIELTKK